MNHKRLFLTLAVLVLASMACSLFSGGGNNSEESTLPSEEESESNGAAPQESAPGGSGSIDTEFPLPSDVQNLMDLGDGAINYQTSMNLTAVVEFYRAEFGKAGYVERPILTVINDDTFSIVWDGHPSGQAIVVQGVDLGNGTTNVNVRLEET
jgi:hypothetical protein